MRINSVSHSDAISKYMNVVSGKPVKGELKAEITDSVVLSEGAQKYASLLKSVKDSVDKSSAAEEAKAADIMARMNSNTYKVPTEDVVRGISAESPPIFDMDTAKHAAEALCLNMEGILNIIGALAVLSDAKEAYVISGDIENLRAATEKEEELLADLGKLEKDRESLAGALSKAIGIFNKNVALSSLIERIEDPGIREKLGGLKNRLGEAVGALNAKNDRLKELLRLQMGYTEYMLNMIVVPRSKGRAYNHQGARQDAANISLLDVRV
jgi:hypothetical protein